MIKSIIKFVISIFKKQKQPIPFTPQPLSTPIQKDDTIHYTIPPSKKKARSKRQQKAWEKHIKNKRIKNRRKWQSDIMRHNRHIARQIELQQERYANYSTVN
jgi:hypothetical protein